MIEKGQFGELIINRIKHDDLVNALDNIFPNSFDSDILSYGFELFDQLLNAYFTPEGVDWVIWWLWEKGGNPDMKAYDENGDEIPTRTWKDLWNLIEKYRK